MAEMQRSRLIGMEEGRVFRAMVKGGDGSMRGLPLFAFPSKTGGWDVCTVPDDQLTLIPIPEEIQADASALLGASLTDGQEKTDAKAAGGTKA
jgi:hypothetical protein